MINSIRNEQYYQYQNVGSYKTNRESNTYSASVTTQSLESDDELQLPPPRPVSEEDYTSSDHMEMMRGGKPAPEMTELSSASEVDEETLEEYDVDGDGEISQDEMPEPGSVKPVFDESTVSSVVSSEDETLTSEDITASTEYQQLIYKTLQAYKHHYESMFDTAEGSLNQGQA